jgi:hypothetical protein
MRADKIVASKKCGIHTFLSLYMYERDITPFGCVCIWIHDMYT